MKIFSKFSVAILTAVFVAGLVGPVSALAASPLTVPLLSAGNFVILGKTAITTTPGTAETAIVGDIGISPAAASDATGFGETMDATNVFSTSALITGKMYASDYTPPTPAYMTTAISAMEAAYTNAAGRTPDETGRNSGLLNSSTTPAISAFAPGVYKWTGNVVISDDITLTGLATDVWIFQIDGNLTLSAKGTIPLGVKIKLAGGALASNVFWQVAGASVDLGTFSTFNGTILSLKYIAMQDGAVLYGRALAQTAVTLIGNTITGAVAPTTASLTVTKIIVDSGGGTKVVSDFPLFIDGMSVTSGTASTTSVGSHTISETTDTDYTSVIGGDCASSGTITLSPSDDKTCTITNTHTPHWSGGSGGSGGYVPTVPTVVVSTSTPLIKVVKIPSRLTPFPFGGGNVTYTYTVTNPGSVALNNVTLTDDRCGRVSRVSGDLNANNLLDLNENWVYLCSTNVPVTTMNIATAKGTANGLTVTNYAFAVVRVAVPSLPNTGFAPRGE